MKKAILFLLITLNACCNRSPNRTVSSHLNESEKIITQKNNLEIDKKDPLEITKGILVGNFIYEKNFKNGIFLDSSYNKPNVIYTFNPYVKGNNDDGYFALRCNAKRGKWCRITINELTGEQLWYDLSNGALNYQSWEEHVLSVFSVRIIDSLNNQLRTFPSETSKKTSLSFVEEDEYLHPLAIRGNWLKVEIGSTGKQAWIKWKEANKLLIELSYMA
jgi:hypothetical protein